MHPAAMPLPIVLIWSVDTFKSAVSYGNINTSGSGFICSNLPLNIGCFPWRKFPSYRKKGFVSSQLDYRVLFSLNGESWWEFENLVFISCCYYFDVSNRFCDHDDHHNVCILSAISYFVKVQITCGRNFVSWHTKFWGKNS